REIMFQIKHSPTEPNPTNFNPNTALPNNYGRVRTLKDDLANLKSGKKEEPPESLPQPPMAPLPPQLNAETPPASQLPNQPRAAARPFAPERKIPLSDSVPAQKEKPAETTTGGQKSDMPNPFGSETFFQTQSPFDEKAAIPKKESEKAPGKSSNKLVIILSSLFVLAILGGGASYWWFFMRSPKKVSAPTTPTAPTTAAPAASETGTDQNSSLKQWTLDLEADKIANKLAVERYAKSLSGSTPQGKAAEVKLVSKDNQAITPQTFSGIFDFSFPASVSEKLTSDYSLFVSNENNEPRLGAAFKLAQSGSLAESLKSEEKDLYSDLKSFYLDKLPADPQTTFNSSKYKNADIRYLNFPNSPNASLDYTVLSSDENSYFIFSTSKDSLRAILDYMSEK
ncbi:MAG: hypothetical protein PHP25_03415, partial [Candidatus Moranbacteria bacterium]|nr:hypothetical protein [Candidatus Moranbacteria bacterium]